MCNKYSGRENLKFCNFCGANTKIESVCGRMYCPNQHTLIYNAVEHEKQPLSIGNIIGKVVKRKSNSTFLSEGDLI